MATRVHPWLSSAVPSVRSFIESCRREFDRADVDSPRLTAELLVAHVLGVDRGAVLGLGNRELTADETTKLGQLRARRVRREPLAYITGQRDFYGRSFAVSPGVLIPRPDTETIIDLAKKLLPHDASGFATDVGTGSGCLAVTLALEFRRLRVIALDISPVTLVCARENARRHGVAGRVCCMRGDLLAAVCGGLAICVANPPYVDPADEPILQPEVRDFEPPVALYADDSGRALARRVIVQALPLLQPGGALLLEFGANQARPMIDAAKQAGYATAKAEPDRTGLPRVLVATASNHT